MKKQLLSKTSTKKVLDDMPDWQLVSVLSVIIIVLVFAISW